VCFFLWSFLSDTYSEKSFSTRYTYSHTLNFIYKYFTEKNIDLVGRVESGRLFTLDEIENFLRHCKFNASNQNDDDTVISFDKLINDPASAREHETRHSSNKVAAATAKARLAQFIAYVNYLFRIFHYDNTPPLDVLKRIHDLRILVAEKKTALSDDNADVSDPFESAIPDDVFLKMLDIIKPSSPKNPFKGSRLRNQLIVKLFIETGVRRGAAAKVKTTDVVSDWSTPRILVTRTPNDLTDSRKLRASQKTKAHSSSISSELLKDIETYISTVRSQYPASDSHEFLFISEKGETKGQPLSLNSFSDLIAVLSKAVGFHLHPHLFRHKWNEIFDVLAKKMGYSDQEIEDLRKYCMGHSENSSMGLIYNSMRNAVKVHGISSQRSSGFMPEVLEVDGEV
jgi:integrase